MQGMPAQHGVLLSSRWAHVLVVWRASLQGLAGKGLREKPRSQQDHISNCCNFMKDLIEATGRDTHLGLCRSIA